MDTNFGWQKKILQNTTFLITFLKISIHEMFLHLKKLDIL